MIEFLSQAHVYFYTQLNLGLYLKFFHCDMLFLALEGRVSHGIYVSKGHGDWRCSR